MDLDLQTTLSKILESCRTKDTWNNADRKFLREFREMLGTPSEIAADLGVSVATIYSWEKQIDGDDSRSAPPERQLKNFSAIIAEKNQKSKFTEVLVRIRSVNEVMERGKFCERFWIMRSGKPFVILKDNNMLNYMIKFLTENDAHSHFVYRDPKEKDSEEGRRICQAKMSFDALWNQLKDREDCKGIIHKICHHPVQDEMEACKLGLNDPWSSFAMAEYSEKGYAKFGKSVDVWMEFVFDTSQNPQLEQSRQLVWLELPLEEAEKWREHRNGFFSKARKKASASVETPKRTNHKKS